MTAFHELLPRLLAVAGLALLVGACGDTGVGGRPGGLPNQNNQEPQCGNLRQACLVQRNDAPLAVGSRTELSIDFENAGQAGLDLSLEATNPDVLDVEGWYIEAVGPGVSGLLIADASGSVVDFLHVWASLPEEMRILAWSQSGDLLGRVQPQVTLLVGDEVLISVEPYTNAQPLLGNFNLNRDIIGDAVAVIPDAVGGLYRVVARSEGQATITFSALGIESIWELEVLP